MKIEIHLDELLTQNEMLEADKCLDDLENTYIPEKWTRFMELMDLAADRYYEKLEKSPTVEANADVKQILLPYPIQNGCYCECKPLNYLHTKMSYPDKNKKMSWILMQTIESRLKGCLSEGDGKPIELNAKQHKLVVSLYNMISNPEPGMENNIFTLDYIIKYYYGKNGKDEKPTKEEREEFYTMLDYFHTTPIVTPVTDEHGETKLLHTYIVDLDYTEGIVNGMRCAELFHIKSVIDLETIGNFSYYEAGLPPRMAHSIENIRIQQAVFDARFSPDNNKEIDFEKLCKSLRIRSNSKHRYEVIKKIRKMIRFYGMGRDVSPVEEDNGKVGHNRIVTLTIQ